MEWVELHLREVMEWIGITEKNPNQVRVRCIILTARPIYIKDVPDKIKIVPYGVFYTTIKNDGKF